MEFKILKILLLSATLLTFNLSLAEEKPLDWKRGPVTQFIGNIFSIIL